MREGGESADEPLDARLVELRAGVDLQAERARVAQQDAPLGQRAVDAVCVHAHPKAEVDDGGAALRLRDLDHEAEALERCDRDA